MNKNIAAEQLADGTVVSYHSIEIVCADCGYDLDEAELEADKCSDCGQDLLLKQSVSVRVTSIPASGEA
jgi:DNA-directed RNA polymerase subunit RPC12/RpoP|tara:strand:- start:1334 stop:1540 length:207 start_codon:yes stop_codon:yes gene_type:complete